METTEESTVTQDSKRDVVILIRVSRSVIEKFESLPAKMGGEITKRAEYARMAFEQRVESDFAALQEAAQ